MPIRIYCGDILKHRADVLVLPCNGSGIMGFVSLAGEVRRLAGRRLYLAYREKCPMQVGDVKLIRAAPNMEQNHILLACTMIWPGTPIPIENVTVTTRAILTTAHEAGFTSLAWPLLGSGGGRVRAEHSFAAMCEEIMVYKHDTGYDPQIDIVERDVHKFRALEALYARVVAV